MTEVNRGPGTIGGAWRKQVIGKAAPLPNPLSAAAPITEPLDLKQPKYTQLGIHARCLLLPGGKASCVDCHTTDWAHVFEAQKSRMGASCA